MKLVLWLTKTILTAAIVTGVSVATTWAVVNAYVQQLLGQFGATSAAEPVGLMDALTSLGVGMNRDAAPASASAETTEPQGVEGGETPSGTAPEEDYPVPDNALPVMGQVGAAESEDDLYISMDDLDAKKDKISDEDRMAIFAMLVTKLPPEEVQAISALLEDGLSAEELEQASTILQKHLTPEEYAELVGILQKY